MPERQKHFSMIRGFHLADFFTLANAACGVAGVFLAMLYAASGSRSHFYAAAAMAPAAFVFDWLDGNVNRIRPSLRPGHRVVEGSVPGCDRRNPVPDGRVQLARTHERIQDERVQERHVSRHSVRGSRHERLSKVLESSRQLRPDDHSGRRGRSLRARGARGAATPSRPA